MHSLFCGCIIIKPPPLSLELRWQPLNATAACVTVAFVAVVCAYDFISVEGFERCKRLTCTQCLLLLHHPQVCSRVRLLNLHAEAQNGGVFFFFRLRESTPANQENTGPSEKQRAETWSRFNLAPLPPLIYCDLIKFLTMPNTSSTPPLFRRGLNLLREAVKIPLYGWVIREDFELSARDVRGAKLQPRGIRILLHTLTYIYRAVAVARLCAHVKETPRALLPLRPVFYSCCCWLKR